MEDLKLKVAQKMVGLVDLPYLHIKLDSNKVISDISALGQIASITTFTHHIHTIKDALNDDCPKISAIINYPNGDFNTYNATQEMKNAIAAGADEIDLVLPYQALVNRQAGLCLKFLTSMREIAEDIPLKLSIEAGVLQDAKWIRKASELAVRSEMDFIKTASGSHRQPVTLTMVQNILNVIQDMNHNVGIHIQTSNNNFLEASQYLEEVINRFGVSWVDASHFRLSGPNLEQSLLDVLNDDHSIQSY